MHLFYSGSEVSHALWCRVASALVPKCLLDTSAPAKKFETLRHQTHGAEMSWVRSVLGPKCPYTLQGDARCHCSALGITLAASARRALPAVGPKKIVMQSRDRSVPSGGFRRHFVLDLFVDLLMCLHNLYIVFDLVA